MLQLCRSPVHNTKALNLTHAFSRGQARFIATEKKTVRRVVTKRTHLLTLPLYEGPTVYSKVAELRELWRKGAESARLESGIIIPSIYHALSVKLGNINIKGTEGTSITTAFNPDSPQPQEEPPSFEREEVAKVMEELKDPIRQLLASHGVDDIPRIPLGSLCPLMHGQPEHFNPHKINVLFLRPSEGKGLDIVTGISKLVHEKFVSLGMLAGAPLKPASANMTLINTANRQGHVPAPGKTRKPFDLQALYELEGFDQFRTDDTEALPGYLGGPLSLNLGVAEVRGLQLNRVTPEMHREDAKPQYDAEVTFAT